jgi:hypothetical protein
VNPRSQRRGQTGFSKNLASVTLSTEDSENLAGWSRGEILNLAVQESLGTREEERAEAIVALKAK